MWPFCIGGVLLGRESTRVETANVRIQLSSWQEPHNKRQQCLQGAQSEVGYKTESAVVDIWQSRSLFTSWGLVRQAALAGALWGIQDPWPRLRARPSSAPRHGRIGRGSERHPSTPNHDQLDSELRRTHYTFDLPSGLRGKESNTKVCWTNL